MAYVTKTTFDAEVAARKQGDTTLTTSLATETLARKATDQAVAALEARVLALEEALANPPAFSARFTTK